jgi:hypothetical protein
MKTGAAGSIVCQRVLFRGARAKEAKFRCFEFPSEIKAGPEGGCHMQQTSFQITSKTNQLDFKRLLRIVAFLGLLAALASIFVLGAKASRVEPIETAGALSPAAAAFATSLSSGFSNGMPLP